MVKESKMVSNIILSEIESFHSIFNEVIQVLFGDEQMKMISSVLVSPETEEFILQMDLHQMEHLKEFALNEDFRIYRHITLSENILLCPLKVKDKQFDEEEFEFVISVYSKSNGKLNGLIYAVVHQSQQERIINHLYDKTRMMLLENTINLLCQKFSAYNRLFFTVNSYLEILSVKDGNMPYHMTNVANLCLKMAKKAKLSVLDTVKLYIAALLHDIGKLYVPDEIINNKKKYSYHEYEAIKEHPKKSAEMAKAELSDLPLLNEVPEIIGYHHERYDGSGYPEALVGEKIPYLSRYLMLADSVDAMLTHRSYKKQKDRKSVIKELEDCSGTQYDPKLVPIIIQVLKDSRNKYNIEEVVGTNYIHNVALSYFYENFNHIETLTGSLVMQKNKGKFILNKPFEQDVRKVEGAKICFYYLNDIYEYGIDIQRNTKDQLIINRFNFEPLEEQFALTWRLKTSMYFNKNMRWDADIIKIGGSSLVFEVKTKHLKEVLEQKKKTLVVPIHFKIEELDEFVEIECKLMQHFVFDDKTVMFTKYLDVKDNKKEKLIRALFKKQILERKTL